MTIQTHYFSCSKWASQWLQPYLVRLNWWETICLPTCLRFDYPSAIDLDSWEYAI